MALKATRSAACAPSTATTRSCCPSSTVKALPSHLGTTMDSTSVSGMVVPGSSVDRRPRDVLPMLRRADDLAVLHDDLAADDGVRRPPLEVPAVVQAPVGGRLHVLRRDHALLLDVDQ